MISHVPVYNVLMLHLLIQLRHEYLGKRWVKVKRCICGNSLRICKQNTYMAVRILNEGIQTLRFSTVVAER